MSGYRQLHTHVWSDSWFEELEPELKLLFIYLFSNERASICGLYELPVRTISFETGLVRELIMKGLEVFNKANKVSYDCAVGVVWVRNMLKYQGNSSPKVQARIQADIQAVPDCDLKQKFLDSLAIPHGRGSDSPSYSSSIDQFKQERRQVETPSALRAPPPFRSTEMREEVLPRSPAEAAVHPELRVFVAVTGGRIPGQAQYQPVIEALRFLRGREALDDVALRAYLAPYWLAWSSRKRQDGRPYDPGNITWLVEWALNRSIPAPGGPKSSGPVRPAAPSPEETRRKLTERDEKIKRAVPAPPELRAKMRSLKEHLAGGNGQ